MYDTNGENKQFGNGFLSFCCIHRGKNMGGEGQSGGSAKTLLHAVISQLKTANCYLVPYLLVEYQGAGINCVLQFKPFFWGKGSNS